jgi:environmental stress-induced protein Ves
VISYSVEIIRKNEFKVSTWSGGSTTQLYIFPRDAVYSERKFKWRLSSAKVEVEESVFTPLPGFSRIIMVIEGKLHLEHKGHHSATLKAYEKDSFSGDWVTRCIGKATDFNLMTDKDCSGDLDSFSIDKGEKTKVVLEHESSKQFSLVTDAFYFVGGDTVALFDGTERQEVHDGDLLMITREIGQMISPIEFKSQNDQIVKVIRATIYY